MTMIVTGGTRFSVRYSNPCSSKQYCSCCLIARTSKTAFVAGDDDWIRVCEGEVGLCKVKERRQNGFKFEICRGASAKPRLTTCALRVRQPKKYPQPFQFSSLCLFVHQSCEHRSHQTLRLKKDFGCRTDQLGVQLAYHVTGVPAASQHRSLVRGNKAVQLPPLKRQVPRVPDTRGTGYLDYGTHGSHRVGSTCQFFKCLEFPHSVRKISVEV